MTHTRQIVRMQCANKKAHPTLFVVPDGYRADWGLRPTIVANQGKVIGGRFVHVPLFCTDHPTLPMRAVLVKGTLGTQECGDKCQSATGPACECKCAGENHGVAA